MSLQQQESSPLASLEIKEREASRLLISYMDAKEEVDALSRDLSDVRSKILDEFLQENLTPLKLIYSLKTLESGEVVLSVLPMPEEGELEFDKFKTSINWKDTNNVPLLHVINYIGNGIPWNNEGLKLYDSTP